VRKSPKGSIFGAFSQVTTLSPIFILVRAGRFFRTATTAVVRLNEEKVKIPLTGNGLGSYVKL
jgi:hypothetical protein